MNPDLYLQNSLTKMSEFHYPVEDLPILKKLLEDWGLTCVYQTCIGKITIMGKQCTVYDSLFYKYVFCIDQLIDMSALQLLKTRHIDKLLSTYPLGILVKFESELEKWKSGLNMVDIDKRTEVAETSTLDISMNKANLEPPLKSFKLSKELNVDVILNSSTQGSLILDYYRQNNKLNDGIRSTLVDILIGQVLSQRIPMSVSLAESIADQIVAIFNSEIKDTYFMKIGCNKNPKGKLYAKFYNSMRNLKNNGLVHTTTKLEKNKTGSGNQEKDGWTDRELGKIFNL